MKEEIKRIHGMIKNPPNIETIHDYKMPQEKKDELLAIGKEQTFIEYESKITASNSEAIRFSIYYKNQEAPILASLELEDIKSQSFVNTYKIKQFRRQDRSIIRMARKTAAKLNAHRLDLRI